MTASRDNFEPMTTELSAIILAAGRGTRMNTPLPKVVHPVAGRPMIERVMRAVKSAGGKEIRVVVGFGEELVRRIVEPMGGVCFKQERQLGTADAVRAAKPDDLEGDVIILNGDHPLLEAADLESFHRQFRETKAQLAVVTCELPDPAKFGRIVRQNGKVRAIVEFKDAGPDTLKIKEVNTGIYVVKARLLKKILPLISADNAQKEFYLTDLVSLSLEDGVTVEAIVADARVALGVNNQAELAMATSMAFKRKAEKLMESGVMMMDPSSVFVEDTCKVEPAAMLYPNVFLRGETVIGPYSVIETDA